MNNQPKGLSFLKQRTNVASGRKLRHRLTRATAKGQETGNLVDLFEKASEFLRGEHETSQPMMMAKAKREIIILRNELLVRGFSEEALNEEYN